MGKQIRNKSNATNPAATTQTRQSSISSMPECVAVVQALLAVGKLNDATPAARVTNGDRVGKDRMLPGLKSIQFLEAPKPIRAGIRTAGRITANNVLTDLAPVFHDSLLCAGVDIAQGARFGGLYFTAEDKQGRITTSRTYQLRDPIHDFIVNHLLPENLELTNSVVLIIEEKTWKEQNDTYDLVYHDDPLRKSKVLGEPAIFHPWALYEKMQLTSMAQVKQIAILSDRLALMETKATEAEKKVAEAEKKVAEAEKKVKETDRELRKVKDHERNTVEDLKRDLGNLEKQLDEKRAEKGGLQASLEDSDK